MTQKEANYVVTHEDDVETLALKLFRKKLVKKLQKEGYDIAKSDFGISDPYAWENYIWFKSKAPGEEIIYTPTESDFKKWYDGGENIFEVYGESTKEDSALFGGKDWIEETKRILKEHGRYTEPETEKEAEL